MNDVNLQLLTSLKPEAASDYLKRKGYRYSWSWRDTWQEAHARAFTVAKAMKMDILTDIREMVQKAVDTGMTFEDFKTRLAPELKSKGWWGKVSADQVPSDTPAERGSGKVQLGSVRRLETIYKTNLQTAYMAGKYKQQIDNADDRPYWQFIAVIDDRTRASHAALHEKVFRFDDPFWDTHYPPLDWGCRCTVHALDAQDVKENKLKIETEASAEKLAEEVPTGEGWNYNPGQAAYKPDLEKYDYDIARQYVEGSITGPDFELFFDGKTKGNYPVAVLDKKYREQISAKSQVVLMSDETLTKNKSVHPELKIADYQKLQQITEKAQTVIQDGDLTLVFIRLDKSIYHAVIKATQNGEELYMTSFRLTGLEDVQRMKAKGRIIKDELK